MDDPTLGSVADYADGGEQCDPQPGAIADTDLGTATIEPRGRFVAGSFQTFTLTYTCGRYGIDDSGSLRICFRFASDQTRPQFDRPDDVAYTTVTASNDAVLEYRYDPKGNVRPWDRTLYIKVVRGFMSAGDTITVVFGDRSHGGPGIRLQTFVEKSFEFRVLVDPIATCNYQALPHQPTIEIVPGAAERWVAVWPTMVHAGEAFALKLKAEDRWGNPSDRIDRSVRLTASASVEGLPAEVRFAPGDQTRIVRGLVVSQPGEIGLKVTDEKDDLLTEAPPLRVAPHTEPLVHFWGDLHGQSEETIGTGTARRYFEFARDLAFLDATGHQGNDFQITGEFWEALDRLAAEFDRDGEFVTLPGYEWSGNTSLGGDRNVYFTSEGQIIRRSSHALVADKSDIDTDATTAAQLFADFAACDADVVCFAHCGGRYADVKMAHDGRFERSMEVHSSWGTFEWLVHDAFEMGYRVGIVANSDGHKGRPGASYPGASLFGAVGGLTCFLMPALTRCDLIECLRRRRHYATTGGRFFLDQRVRLATDGVLYHDDPALGGAQGQPVREARMGDLIETTADSVALEVTVSAAVPIERVDIFNGLQHIEAVRPYAVSELGSRMRVHWEGAEYRGRFRQVIWDGSAHVSDNEIVRARPFNFFNRDKTLDRVGGQELKWRALTTGNSGGFDIWLQDAYAGTLKLETPLIKCGIPIEDIGYEDEVLDASGALPRFIRVFRLPDENRHRSLTLNRQIPLDPNRDNPIYFRVILEDGHMGWTSPTYLFR